MLKQVIPHEHRPRIHVVNTYRHTYLIEAVNLWLKEGDYAAIVDIQYNVTTSGNYSNTMHYSAMIIYTHVSV